MTTMLLKKENGVNVLLFFVYSEVFPNLFAAF